MSVNVFADRTSGARWDIETEKRFYSSDGKYLEPYGFKVYSQNDEDGIISEIFNRIGVTDKRFIEFGVQNGLESNCHYLLLKGWTGLWIEGNKKSCKDLERRFEPALKDGRLKLVNAFITVKNINTLFRDNGMTGDIDLLSIDIDGNDYHIWEAISVIQPRVVVIEYNAKFPPECEWVMPYDENHVWDLSDRHGASLKALEMLGGGKGYQLVGTNMTGSNAFFVRAELAQDKFPLPANAENLYNPPRWIRLDYETTHMNKAFLGYQDMFDVSDIKQGKKRKLLRRIRTFIKKAWNRY